jgi:hypothetical protein
MRVIDNKKIDLTDDEWSMYKTIVKSYTTNTNKGEDLFIDLFETDESGMIIFIKPPSKRQTSFEVFLFIISVMVHQHLRASNKQVDDVCNQMKEKMNELDQQLALLKKKTKG